MPRFAHRTLLGTLIAFLITGSIAYAQTGLRVGVGYDSSKISLNSLTNPFSHLGSARWNISYDLNKGSKLGFHAMAYYDTSPDLFKGGGLGLRIYPPSLTSRSPYYAVGGVGIYDPEGDNSKNKVGYKLGLGIDSSSLFFTELNYTLFKEDGYKARPSIVLGVRL